MNSLKTLMVVAVMGIVAYGVYATLTKAPPASEEDSLGPTVEMPTDAIATSVSDSTGSSSAPKFLPTEPAAPAPRYGGRATATDDYVPSGETSSPLDSTFAPPDDVPPGVRGPAQGFARAADNPLDDASVVAATAVSPDLSAGPPQSEFQQAMAQVHDLLDRNQLAAALRALTPWYDRKLATDEQAEVAELLDQLAGTVIYSRQHLLAPAYVVQPGDRLQDIAARFNVPWQLLGKINGISSPSQLKAGDTLKVIPGPFSAIVEGSRYRLTLFVGGCYAGKFQVGLANNINVPAGTYEVQDKIDNPTYTTTEGREYGADDPLNPVGEYWIELGDGLGIHGTIDPDSIGSTTASGGVSLNAFDVQQIFDILSIGSQILIRR